MFVLDTNVVPKLVRGRPSPDVLRWMGDQTTDNPFATCVTEAEVRTGVAMLAAARRAAGRPASQADCQIAAIARSMGASIVTGNARDFSGTGIDIVDPWRA